MIDGMLLQVKQYLPLKISKVEWDGTVFQMHGPSWNFNTLSAWRISSSKKMIFGCFDSESRQLIASIHNLDIVTIDLQTSSIAIDPVFVLSNGQKIEIFSTDTYEPWTFEVNPLGFFVASPSEPTAFDVNKR